MTYHPSSSNVSTSWINLLLLFFVLGSQMRPEVKTIKFMLELCVCVGGAVEWSMTFINMVTIWSEISCFHVYGGA